MGGKWVWGRPGWVGAKGGEEREKPPISPPAPYPSASSPARIQGLWRPLCALSVIHTFPPSTSPARREPEKRGRSPGTFPPTTPGQSLGTRAQPSPSRGGRRAPGHREPRAWGCGAASQSPSQRFGRPPSLHSSSGGTPRATSFPKMAANPRRKRSLTPRD